MVTAEGRKKWLGLSLLSVVAAIGVATVLVSTNRYGAGISPDSVNYIAAGRSLLQGKGWVCYYSAPFVQWPPLFPSLLALIATTGVDPATAARYANAVTFGLVILLCGVWIRMYTRSALWGLTGSIVVLLGRPLFSVSCFAWTEPLFALWVLLFLFKTRALFVANLSYKTVIALGSIAALASLTRYIGITVIATGLILLLIRPGIVLRKKLLPAVLFAGISASPTLIWLTRNMIVAGTLTGGRAPAARSLFDNILRLAQTLFSWLTPLGIPYLPVGRVAKLAILAFGAVLVAVVAGRLLRQYNRGQSRLSFPPTPVVLVSFLAIYVLAILASALVTFGALKDRWLSPLYAPGAVFLLCLLAGNPDTAKEEVALNRNRRLGKWLRAAASIGLAVWIAMASLALYQRARRMAAEGAGGYSTRQWHNSETIAYLRSHQLEGVVLSNAPDAIYILTGLSTQISPRPKRGRTSEAPRQPPDGLAGAYLVWFKSVHRNYLLTPNDLSGTYKLDPVSELEDGVIYFLENLDATRGDPARLLR